MAQTSTDLQDSLTKNLATAKVGKKNAHRSLNGSATSVYSSSSNTTVTNEKKSRPIKWSKYLPWNWGKTSLSSSPILPKKDVTVINPDNVSEYTDHDEKRVEIPDIIDLKAKALIKPSVKDLLEEANLIEPGSHEGSAISSGPSSRIQSTNSSIYMPSGRSSLYISARSTITLPSKDGTDVTETLPPSVTIDGPADAGNDIPDTNSRPAVAVATPVEPKETMQDKAKNWGILLLFAVTGIDFRPKPILTAEEEAKEKATELSRPLKIISYVTSVVVAIASGMITAVAVAALHIPASLIVLIGLAGYRVNLLVYKSAVDYLLGNFRDFGKGFKESYAETFNQHNTVKLIKRIGLALSAGIKQGFIKGFFQDPSSPTGEMSRTKKILTGVGIFLSFAGGASLAAMTFTSASSALVHIFAVIGFASLGAFPPVLAGVMAVIALVAMTALMYKSIHIAIKENAHIKLLNFIKDLKHPSNATTSEIVKHYVISSCKVLFIAAGVALAVVATVATLGAWQHSMVTLLTGIPGAYVKACEIASYLLVFGLTAAGRIPMVIDKAASVFSTIGGFVGKSLFTLGEKTASLFGYKPQYQKLNDASSQKSLWDSIKGECTDPQTNKFSGWNAFIFASKTTAQVLAIGLVAGIVIGSIFLNAGGNGAVADEGASFLTKILNFFHVYPSSDIQSGMPFFTGGLVSLILGLDGARTTYLSQEPEMKDMSQKDSSQKTFVALHDADKKHPAHQSDSPSPVASSAKYQSLREANPSIQTESSSFLDSLVSGTKSVLGINSSTTSQATKENTPSSTWCSWWSSSSPTVKQVDKQSPHSSPALNSIHSTIN